LTVDNLVIATFEENRANGNSLPESWTLKQVVTVGDVRLIASSHEAAKAWKADKERWSKMTEAEKTEWTAEQQRAEQKHRQLVREITRGYAESLPLIEQLDVMTLESLLDAAEMNLSRLNAKMRRQLEVAIQTGTGRRNYATVKEQRVSLDAFHGAHARCWIVQQTLRQ
uniref:hypothetical protein n=1 Tax=Modestobacter versicolor TaxID=429133 RepID=UPI0034E03158